MKRAGFRSSFCFLFLVHIFENIYAFYKSCNVSIVLGLFLRRVLQYSTVLSAQ